MTTVEPRVLVLAHRGDARRAPENSMAAFEAALDAGVDGCETDVRVTTSHCGACGRACSEVNVDQLGCKDGVCRSTCDSGWVNKDRPETGPDDGCETPGRRVFVTEELMTAEEVGSVIAADLFCHTTAQSQALGGVWKAWLSGATQPTSPEARFVKTPAVPYMLLNFTQVAADWDELIGGKGSMLDHPIDLTELGLPPSLDVFDVWTGTNPLGQQSGDHCNQWVSAVADPSATAGLMDAISTDWTQAENGLLPCDEVARLYCFEQ